MTGRASSLEKKDEEANSETGRRQQQQQPRRNKIDGFVSNSRIRGSNGRVGSNGGDGDMTLSQLPQILNDLTSTMSSIIETSNKMLKEKPEWLPPGPDADISVGMVSNPVATVAELSREYGKIVGARMAGENIVLVADSDVAAFILSTRAAKNLTKEGTAFFPTSELTGNGLLVSDGDVWKRQRRLANPAFRTASVNRYKEVMLDEAASLFSAWSSGKKDVYREYNDLTLRIASRTLFGASVTGTEAGEINDAIKTAFTFFSKRAANPLLQALPSWVPIQENLEFADSVRRLDAAVFKIIQERRNMLLLDADSDCSNNISRSGSSSSSNSSSRSITREDAGPLRRRESVEGGLLDTLLLEKDEEGKGMTDESLRDELNTLIIAGQETSAILLAWTTALLAFNPASIIKVQREIDDFFNKKKNEFSDTAIDPIGEDYLSALPFLQACILESMRLYPPAFLMGRNVNSTEGQQIGDFSIPKDTTVLLAPYVIHRDPAIYHSPNRFLPERWLESEKGDNNNNNNNNNSSRSWVEILKDGAQSGQYLPFGAGPRVCIGTGFAMLEASIVLVELLRRFSLRPTGKLPEPNALITLRPSMFEVELRARMHYTSR
eukprot:jgi/Bigna1/138472/aug1.45_g13180